MKTLIAAFATVAVLAGFGANDAKAENFFRKMGKKIEKAHDRHVDMMKEAHERHTEILLGDSDDRGRRGRDDDRGRCDRDDDRSWRGRDDDRRGWGDRHHRSRRGIRIEFGHSGYGEGCGHYEAVEVQVLVEASWTIEYETVQDPGHYEDREVEHLTPGHSKSVWVDAVYRINRDHCGNETKVLVKAGYWDKVWVPEVRYTTIERVWVEGECRQVAKRVCVPAHYETKTVQVWVCD